MGMASVPVGTTFCLFADEPATLTDFHFLVEASSMAHSNCRLDSRHSTPAVLLSVLGPVIVKHFS